MDMSELVETAFHASLIHPGMSFYVTNALKGDTPVAKDGYLVMVNEHGDRVAYCVPGGKWEIDPYLICGYNSKIPHYKNAIKIPPLSLENE